METVIRVPLDRIVAATQQPDAHVRWDRRFDTIVPLGRRGRWQRFRYETRVVPGLRLRGTGESVFRNGVSVLGFAADGRSPIAHGAGYWRYVETGEGVRFSTAFDYAPGLGRPGAVLDRILVRACFARATARSFDRLRRWLEEGVAPESLRGRFGARSRRVRWSIGAPR